MSGIDACIKVAQLTAAAGEMAPFPFIKGAAECVVLVLESIKGVSKNKKDMQELAESIVAILADIRDTIIEHGPTSATRFQTICVEYQTRMTDLLSELNSKCRSPQGIWKYLRATKVSDDINDLQQRIRAIQKSFLVRTATMTQLAVSDVQDQVAAGFSTLTGSVEASERQITSTIKENIDEIRTLGARQSENMENLSTRLLQASHQRGLYKGLVWDFIPGDIRIIKPATRSLGSYCTTRTVTYKDSYGTVENSDTWKIIREYQALGDNGEDAMKQLDKALDIFMKLKRHPNVAQIFGVCRSPNLPVIIFHGTTRVPFSHYQRNLTAKRFLPFYYELIQDLRSVLKFWPRSLSRTCTTYPDENALYVNEYDKIVFGDLHYSYYDLNLFYLSLTGARMLHLLFAYNVRGLIEQSRIGRWMWRSGGLRDHYEAIEFLYMRGCSDEKQLDEEHPYAQGSVVTDPSYRVKELLGPDSPRAQETLVGRLWPSPLDWKWEVHLLGVENEQGFLSLDNGSVTMSIEPSSFHDLCVTICVRSGAEIMQSWIAQASKMYSYLRSMGYGDDVGLDIIDGTIFTVYPKDRDSPCHLCNLTNDHHALSLSITAPIIDYKTNMIKSFPIISCLRTCGMDSVEADVPLRVRKCFSRYPFQLHKTVVLTIPELNAEYGFDPGREGADVCEHFGWPLLQILDPSTGEWTSNGAASQSSGPAPVVSDNTSDQMLNEEHDSIPCGTDVTMGNIKEAQAGEAPTKTEIVPVLQHDISTRLLIVVFIAIGIQVLILSSFHNYL